MEKESLLKHLDTVRPRLRMHSFLAALNSLSSSDYELFFAYSVTIFQRWWQEIGPESYARFISALEYIAEHEVPSHYGERFTKMINDIKRVAEEGYQLVLQNFERHFGKLPAEAEDDSDDYSSEGVFGKTERDVLWQAMHAQGAEYLAVDIQGEKEATVTFFANGKPAQGRLKKGDVENIARRFQEARREIREYSEEEQALARKLDGIRNIGKREKDKVYSEEKIINVPAQLYIVYALPKFLIINKEQHRLSITKNGKLAVDGQETPGTRTKNITIISEKAFVDKVTLYTVLAHETNIPQDAQKETLDIRKEDQKIIRRKLNGFDEHVGGLLREIMIVDRLYKDDRDGRYKEYDRIAEEHAMAIDRAKAGRYGKHDYGASSSTIGQIYPYLEAIIAARILTLDEEWWLRLEFGAYGQAQEAIAAEFRERRERENVSRWRRNEQEAIEKSRLWMLERGYTVDVGEKEPPQEHRLFSPKFKAQRDNFVRAMRYSWGKGVYVGSLCKKFGFSLREGQLLRKHFSLLRNHPLVLLLPQDLRGEFLEQLQRTEIWEEQIGRAHV